MTLRLLVSYHYHRNTDLAALVAELGGDVDLFADSGAYSAATTGATIKLADYAAWLRDWAPLWTVQAGLDVIGDHEATAANTTRLHEAGLSVLPTFHLGSPWRVLEALTAAEHRTVFHGFGLTSAQMVKNLPFYSIDSSSYMFGSRWGLAYLWNAPAWRMESVLFRNPAEVRPHAHLFRHHGLDPTRVIDPAFMRPGTDHAAADRTDVSAAGARAYAFMEQSLTRRHQVAPPPLPRGDDTGTKVYLALGGASDSDFAPLRRLAGAVTT